MRAALILVGLCAAARADVDIVGAAGGPGADGALVGRGGEIFRHRDGRWRRLPGGVSTSLTAAGGASATDVWAVGRRLFRHDGASWSVVPDAGRATVLSTEGSAAPGVALGRAVRVRAAGNWVPLPAAPGAVAALWVGGARDVIAITDAGLARWDGRAWKAMSGIARPRALSGTAAGVLVFADDGVWRVGRGRAQRMMTLAPDLAGIPLSAASNGKGRTFVLFPGALAAIDKDALVRVAELPRAAAHDPLALVARAEAVAVVTRRGAVVVWDGAATWSDEPVDATPALPTKPGPQPAVVR